MRSVAALAGVGLKTVSRVINGEPHVSPELQERVLHAIATLNYRAHEQASSLKRLGGRTNTLGLLVGNVANPFSGAIHRAVEEEAVASGLTVFASSLDDDPERERSMVETFLRRRVDGLILTTVADSQSYLSHELARGTAIAFVDRDPVGVVADVIASDNLGGSRTATEHLLERDHRRIAYLGDDPRIHTAKLRKAGFRAAFTDRGIAADERFIVEDLRSPESSEEAVLRLFETADAPTALYTSQNLVTIGAIRALKTLGLQHQIALIGFDDVPLGDLLEPGISVVAQNAAAIGRTAARRVLARIEGLALDPETVHIPTELIQRGSGEIAPRG